MRILVVEDDALLGDGIQAGLKQQGFGVDWVRDGVAAQHAVENEPFAAVVLDLGLPRRSGLEVLKSLRQQNNSVPVLILTARDTVDDRITGLDAGADDYLVKPFDLGELSARLRALIRRAGGQASPVITVGALSLDPAARTVSYRGEEKALSAREFDLLQVFMNNAGRVLNREQLASALYAWGEEIESNAIDVHLHHLRRKISPDIVQTLRGVGYLMPKEVA
ncbi:response regulator transcription factor [Betaproteobacteria bacterium SCN2]|jgi:two-component system OmpR family response regulator/two-component system response regulator QseB|nr:response regulator transcription factor [Betaproteobacteria bacterium SCN2]